ncbi:L-threonylcarbamoyladenylate synthase [Idiomarina loihiensis]|jgi:tRNA threonylcarbamoyl adenosine modification protein (Sua5/YciO/YrdC/YwlC family)|uniref:Possible translation factor, Sua5/YciO/YrdC/YwlC family n=1 Tax=Idiomarina loihiensis (strain ATCC BAA-735 / DSM 15497 / L2-TR) TaxID=283942 RepID=Q5QX74_IDILO|nr:MULTISPECIES: L-threonylcarbamoyladenylate synthase [Idiomarina]PHQ90059.1 MAG: threonylcarbamoyl-AMP synthase [Idiomarina sp.]AAV82579.1 Possible translation factor, Sua5/YciO/YrdC/YwlC family [Idiomarina loihiensis L2TR]AGM36620.1 Sua5 family translation factor [Idiomarina loihiensis GSL 199]MRJ45429.1 threonylcarbamoyl-AMP synthase [Idiomarina loihiensis]TDO49450.1 translation factor SUA5 [Idiomarina sp. 017G]|tara:strand:- start:1078 stop:1701 length:624 start_codon:yes stop_codon:yes gene_type:complete
MSQYFEIHPENPQARLIQQSVQIIRKSGVVVYPTDSGYAIGCQIGNKAAADRICQIREIDKEHNFTLMCRDLSELATYARVDNDAFRLLKNNTPGPYTFILKGTKEVPKRLLNPKRKTIGIRVPTNRIAMALLEELNEPLMSTSLILGQGMLAESDPEEIRDKLEKLVDLIIDGGHKGEEPTTVVDLSEGAPTIRREGSGDVEPFDF